MILIANEDPGSADATTLLHELTAVLQSITGDGGTSSFAVDELNDARACFAVARDASGAPIGCAALRPMSADVAELKRMYARPGHHGAGRALLAFLEAEASRFGYRALRLSTRVINARAVRFYEREGYARIAGFGKYAGSTLSVCFEKSISAA